MLVVYNIRKEKFAEIPLKASGIANRWNKANEFVVYAGSSRALSTLELVVHRSSINIESSYKLIVICLEINETDVEELDTVFCRSTGDLLKIILFYRS